jgi:hypothetical protein
MSESYVVLTQVQKTAKTEIEKLKLNQRIPKTETTLVFNANSMPGFSAKLD